MNVIRCCLLLFLAFSAPCFATVVVTSPAKGSTVTSPVHYVGSATTSTCSKGVASMGIYVDNKKVYVVDGRTLDTELTMATGSRHTVVEEWDKCGGATVTDVNLTVVAALKPTVKIAAAPTSIVDGSSSVLTVTATHATTVTIKGSDSTSYTLEAAGGAQTVKPGVTTTYTTTATGAGGTVTAKTTVTVTAAPAATVSIAASPSSVVAGDAAVLTVVAAHATAVKIAGSDGTSYTLGAAGGSQSVSPTATTTYTATATGLGKSATARTTVTVTAPAATVSISAKPSSIQPGGSSVLTVSASNATQLKITGSDSSVYTLNASGGTQTVSPAATTTYTATATGAGSPASATTTVTVSAGKTVTSLAVTPNAASFAMGTTQQFSATATYSDSSTANVTTSAAWTVANTAVATINSAGLATAQASGLTSVTATLSGVSGNTPLSVIIAPGTGVTIPTWHADANRSGLNANEASLSTGNVNPQSFGKLFSYMVDGYAYAEPLLMSNITINGSAHNVVYVATEHDSVYAFDADTYGTGAPLWQVSLLQPGETPNTSGPILPYEGVTSTPVIDPTTNTIYVVSKQTGGGTSSFRLSALDITTGVQKFGGPVTINASVKATNSAAVDGVQHLPTSCTQRAALLLAYGNVYIGFGSCHSGWLLGYNATTLAQTGVFNASPNLDGEGLYASAGGVWMGSGGPAADGAGNVYITTGNGPWDGQTAFSDSILKFDSSLNLEDYFTPNEYAYMNCADQDLASGGLLLIPGAGQAVAGGKGGKLYLVSTASLGHESPTDSGATQTLFFEPDLSPPYSDSCTDSSGTHTTLSNSYEIFGTSAYFNGSIYLGVIPTSANAPAGVRQFVYSGNSLSASTYTSPSIQQNTRGTTPFISANGGLNGILWMIDTGLPLQSTGAGAPTTATLRAYDATNLTTELYNSQTNPSDTPGYGIKFSSPVVGNGKAYISTGHDKTTVTNPQGEIDVYGLN